MTDKTIPISEITLARLQELARWFSVSLDAALDQAIKDQYDRKFWQATNAAYAALRADPRAWAEIEEERRSMDGTLMDGLDPSERWTDDGNVIPPGKPDAQARDVFHKPDAQAREPGEQEQTP